MTCSNLSGSMSDTVAANVVAPLSVTISSTYSKLLLYAPNLGQSAQTLSGSVSGVEGPYSLIVHVFSPIGVETTYSPSGSN
ncbi:MAG: hypothetical protein AB9907_09840 [Flexilinea sp.]